MLSGHDANGSGLPFPLLFAEPVPDGFVGESPRADVGEVISGLLGRAAPCRQREQILILTNTADPHADRVGGELLRRGHPIVRFNTDEFPTLSHLSIRSGSGDERMGEMRLPGADAFLDAIRTVWYRRPDIPLDAKRGSVPFFVARESEAVVRDLCHLLDAAFWVSNPDSLRACDTKLTQLRDAAALGLRVPRTLVTNDPNAVRDFFDACDGHMIVKTYTGWSGVLDGRLKTVFTSRVLRDHLARLDSVRAAPCLLQEYIPKDLELRVTVIGRRIFPVAIHSQLSAISRDDWRHYDIENTPYTPCELPREVAEACLALLGRYGLQFGAFDFVLTPDGEYVFLELNGNGQWLWIEELTGVPMVDAMVDLLVAGRSD